MEQLSLFDNSTSIEPAVIKSHFDSLPRDPRPVLPGKKPVLPRNKISGWFTNTLKSYPSRSAYYQSKDWRLKRKIILKRDNNQCQDCGCQLSRGLEIHHLNYYNLYHEKPEDLTTLCPKCHEKADRARERETAYNNAFDTYINKKYGDRYQPDGCDEMEFQDWLERKERNRY